MTDGAEYLQLNSPNKVSLGVEFVIGPLFAIQYALFKILNLTTLELRYQISTDIIDRAFEFDKFSFGSFLFQRERNITQEYANYGAGHSNHLSIYNSLTTMDSWVDKELSTDGGVGWGATPSQRSVRRELRSRRSNSFAGLMSERSSFIVRNENPAPADLFHRERDAIR